MKEDFITYIWKFQAFQSNNLRTIQNEKIQVLSIGQENTNTGPDFFNTQLIIDDQKWAGNVELHIKSSDWYVHGHEKDENYDSVILHVVWEHDVEVYRKDKTFISTLELKQYVNNGILNNYQKLFVNTQKWINCEHQIHEIDDFLLFSWFERLYIERLEQKSVLISELLAKSKNDWEAVLFILLTKNFGLKVNGKAFFDIANEIDFGIVRKQQQSLESLEALLFGKANLLNETLEDPYYLHLQKEYSFIKNKFNLNESYITPIQFFRLRPNNFPTIRLAQLAALYNKHQNLFSELMAVNKLKDFYRIFDISVSRYWKHHYSFTSPSKKSAKKVTKAFVDLLIINTIIPLKFMYFNKLNNLNQAELLMLVRELKPEKNGIIDRFKTLKISSKNTLESQALIQLKNEYCSKQKCLQCSIGIALLNNS